MQKVIFFIILNLFSIFFISCNFNKINNENNLIDKISNINKIKDTNIIYFDSNKYNLSYETIKILKDYAFYLIKYPLKKLIIEGHTDENGTSEYNISLGEKRCNIVKLYLQLQGVNINQIKIISYGKELPEELGHKEKIYKKNRRVVLNLVKNFNI